MDDCEYAVKRILLPERYSLLIINAWVEAGVLEEVVEVIILTNAPLSGNDDLSFFAHFSKE